jgi:hypothetical protein
MLLTRVIAGVFVSLLFLPGLSPADNKAASDGITAEVRGTLRFEEGRGYFIEMKPVEPGGQAKRVWLRVSEDKVLVRRLEELKGKRVAAKGPLGQMPEDAKGAVPPHGLYLAAPFEVEPAKER